MSTKNITIGKKTEAGRVTRAWLFVLLLAFVVLLAGCADKPQLFVKTEFEEVLTPVKCGATLPEKPKFSESEPQSWVEIGEYHDEIERVLKACIADTDVK